MGSRRGNLTQYPGLGVAAHNGTHHRVPFEAFDSGTGSFDMWSGPQNLLRLAVALLRAWGGSGYDFGTRPGIHLVRKG
jgi:hypothetical protein